MPALSVVIVNWNTLDLLRACLASLRAQPAAGGTEVIVVDNGSSDGSPAMVAAEFPEVRLFALTENRGFGGGNNLGFAESRGRVLLALNSDTEVHPGAMDALVAAFDDDPAIGAAGARLLNTDGTIQLSCRRFPDWKTAFFHRYSLMTRLFPNNRFSRQYLMTDAAHDRPRRPDWVSGACLAVRGEVYQAVGGLDEDYFMYAEDVDWCYRIRKAGWEIAYVPDARVTHHIGRSTRKAPYRMIYQRHRSMWTFYRKHYSRGVTLVDVATALGIAGRCAMLTVQAFVGRMLGRGARA